jgi:hypothetical protein
MLFDSTLMFYHATSGASLAWQFTAGEFVSLVGMTTLGSASAVINLGNARDLGVGIDRETPRVELHVGTALTTSEGTTSVFAQFQGSTDSVNWTTYMQTPATSVGFSGAWGSASVIAFDVPQRPPGAALPLYYRMNIGLTSGTGTVGLSTGTILGGIVLASDAMASTGVLYKAGFSVA